jgi:hypothetical protein
MDQHQSNHSKQVGLPAIDQMSEELLQSLDDTLGPSGVVRLSDTGVSLGGDPIEQFGIAFHRQAAPLHVWQSFLECAPSSHLQGESLDSFAATFLDLATVTSDEALFAKLPELLAQASWNAINVLEYVDGLAQDLPEYVAAGTQANHFAIARLQVLICSELVERREIGAIERINTDPLFKDLRDEVITTALRVAPEVQEAFSLHAFVEAYACKEFNETLTTEVRTELLERLRTGEELNTFCTTVTKNSSLLAPGFATTAQHSIASALQGYRKHGWDSTSLFQGVYDLRLKENSNVLSVNWPEHLKMTVRCMDLGVAVPLFSGFMVYNHSHLSDKQLAACAKAHRLARLAPLKEGELSFVEREGKITALFETELYISGSTEKFSQIEAAIVDLENHERMSYQALALKFRNAACADLIAPLTLEEVDKKESMQLAVKGFLFPTGSSAGQGKRRPLKAVAATRSLIDLYKRKQWSMGTVLERMNSYSKNHHTVGFNDNFCNAVRFCIAQEGRFDGFTPQLINGLSTPPSEAEIRMLDVYQGLIAKGREALPDIGDRIKQEDTILKALQALAVVRHDEQAVARVERKIHRSFDGSAVTQGAIEGIVRDAVSEELRQSLESYYEQMGWDATTVIAETETLIGEIIDTPLGQHTLDTDYTQILLELHNGIAQYQEQGWKLEGLFGRFRKLKGYTSASLAQNLPQIAERFRALEIPMEHLGVRLIKQQEIISDEVLSHVKGVSDSLHRLNQKVKVNRRIALSDIATETILSLTEMAAGDYLFEKVREGIDECRNPNSNYLTNLKRDLTAHRAIQLLSYGARWRSLPEERQKPFARAAVIMKSFTTDHLPFAIPRKREGIEEREPEMPEAARVMLEETHAAFRFGFDMSYGFKSLRYPCSRIGEERAEIADFGIDAGGTVFGLHASSIEKLPGRGYMLVGLDPLKAFEPDPESLDTARATFSKYYDAWSFGHGLDHLEQTQFWFTRQFIALTAPTESQFSIAGNHYSLIAVNMARKNPFCNKLLAVPTEVWSSFFEGTLVPIDEYESGSFTAEDLSAKNLTIENLRLECKQRGLPIFDITSGSAFRGSLVNAGTPQGAPYHEWEAMRQRETKDAWGHVHKSHGLGDWTQHQRMKDGDEMDIFLEPIREGHAEINAMVSGYRDIMFCTLKYLHYWRRGLTITDDLEDPHDEAETTEDEGAFETAPNAGRMLEYAYSWYNHLQENADAVRHQPPILYAQQELSLGRLPLRPLLDTADLTVFDGTDWQQLPAWGNGTGEEELALFRQHVLTSLEPSEGLCFLDREFAKDYL